MALDRETVGLIFKLEADSKQASTELDQFKKKIGDTSKESAAIARESFTTLSSEIIESFGVDGDIANSLASSMLKIQRSTLVAVGAFGGLAIGAGVVVGGLLSLAKSTTETVTEIGDLAEKTQLSTETISAFRIALQDGNSSLSTFEGAVSSLQEKMTAARLGNAGMAKEFRQLGIDINQGTEPALRQIIARYNQLPQGAERTAFATRLFGSAGEDLVLTLNSLEGDLDGYTAKLRELGLVVTPDAVASAKQFDDQMKLLDRQLEGLKVTLGNLVIPAFTAWTTTINIAGKAIRDLVNGTNAASISITKLFGALLLGSNAATANLVPKLFEGELPKTDTGTKTPLPAGFGKRGGGPRAAKPDEASREELRRLQIQLAEEERLYKEQAAALRRTFEQREIDEAEFVQKQIAALEARLATETAILERERAVVEKSRFSKEDKLTKLEEIGTKEKDLARQTADEIEKINDDSRRRLEQQGIQLAEAQVRTTEAMLSRKAALIRQAAEQEQISLREAEAQLGEIYRQSAEERLALANAELTRAGENTRAREIATERIKALEIELAAITEQTAARVEEARRRDVESLIRKTDELIRLRSIELEASFGGDAAQAIAIQENLFGRQLDYWERLRVAAGAYANTLRQDLGDAMGRALNLTGVFTEAFSSAIDAFVSSGGSIKAAAKALAVGLASPYIDAAKAAAKYYAAMSIASFAALDFRGGILYGLASAGFAALAAVGTALISGGGAASKTVAPGTSGFDSRNAKNEKRIIEQGDRQRPGPQIIIIRAETEPGVVVRKVIDDYRSNGPTRNVLRADMLGASA